VAERKAWWEILRDQFASRGLLDPESERLQEAAQAAPAVQRQARGLLSLDPQAESDTALEMGLGSLPGVGQAMALRDFERARRTGDKLGMGLATLAAVPVVGSAAKAAGELRPMERKLKELYGDYWRLENLGVPQTDAYKKIFQEVGGAGDISDDALLNAIRAHPDYRIAKVDNAAQRAIQEKRPAAAKAIQALGDIGADVRFDASRQSRSAYVYATKNGKTVKIRLSNHPSTESGMAYGFNDVSATPQNWKSAVKQAQSILEEQD
jgi:hypothetical protein